MTINQHLLERVVRIALGLALLTIVFIGPKTQWGLIGLVPLLTGAMGFCPLYRVFGFSTCALSPTKRTGAHS